MAVTWSRSWKNANFNNVDPSLDKSAILAIIRAIPPAILRVQPAAVRTAVNLVIADSEDVTICKGLHHVGSEKIDIKKTGGAGGPGPLIHLYCMRYSLVDAGRLRFVVENDIVKQTCGWRVTGSSEAVEDGNEAFQGMDKTGEIAALKLKGYSNKAAENIFRMRHY